MRPDALKDGMHRNRHRLIRYWDSGERAPLKIRKMIFDKWRQMLEPERTGWVFGRSIRLYRSGRVDEAIAVLKRLHSNYPNNINTIYALAKINDKEKRVDECIRWCEAGLGLDSRGQRFVVLMERCRCENAPDELEQ